MDVKTLIADCINEAKKYECASGTSIIRDCAYPSFYTKSDQFEEVYNEIIDEHRWYNIRFVVIKITNPDTNESILIGTEWCDPASECQEGQDTDCRFFEVTPKEIVKTIYEEK